MCLLTIENGKIKYSSFKALVETLNCQDTEFISQQKEFCKQEDKVFS